MFNRYVDGLNTWAPQTDRYILTGTHGRGGYSKRNSRSMKVWEYGSKNFKHTLPYSHTKKVFKQLKSEKMPHIDVDKNLPGIRALLAFSPETAEPIGAMAEILLRTDDSLSRADRD